VQVTTTEDMMYRLALLAEKDPESFGDIIDMLVDDLVRRYDLMSELLERGIGMADLHLMGISPNHYGIVASLKEEVLTDGQRIRIEEAKSKMIVTAKRRAEGLMEE